METQNKKSYVKWKRKIKKVVDIDDASTCIVFDERNDDMDNTTELEKVSRETMRFIRGKYLLDEVYDGADTLDLCDNGETFVSIRICDDRYDFIIGDTCVPVADMDALDAVKQIIVLKKKPDRTPFPKETAVYSRCGMRCDLCAHYAGGGVDAEFRKMLMRAVDRVYGNGDEPGYRFDENNSGYDDCPGCGEQSAGKPHPCMNGQSCEPLGCAGMKGLDKCTDCAEYPCDKAVAGYREGIGARKSITAYDVTWAILPYVEWQYCN